jgi:predicted TIM-barrel fold metal-dependent hydrolase
VPDPDSATDRRDRLLLVSSDSHVVEPADLWLERLPRAFRERAPRASRDPGNGHVYFNATGTARGVDLTLSVSAGLSNAEVDSILADDPDAVPGVLGGADASARLRDLREDGVVADVLYPTCGLALMQSDDAPLQEACFSVYNDWLAAFCATDPARLIGLALIACWDMGRATAELERARGLGLRGAVIWTAPPTSDSFFHPRYERLWSAAEALGMPLAVHTLGGQRASRDVALLGTTVEASFHVAIDYRQELQRTVCELVAAGVFARHPRLRVVGAEAGIHFLAEMARRLDSGYRGFWSSLPDNELTEPPSFYLRRNVWLTYISDPVGLSNVGFTGTDRLMWSGDYPHGASTWPRSREIVDREHAALDREDLVRLTSSNCADLYGIDLAEVAHPSPVIDLSVVTGEGAVSHPAR